MIGRSRRWRRMLMVTGLVALPATLGFAVLNGRFLSSTGTVPNSESSLALESETPCGSGVDRWPCDHGAVGSHRGGPAGSSRAIPGVTGADGTNAPGLEAHATALATDGSLHPLSALVFSNSGTVGTVHGGSGLEASASSGGSSRPYIASTGSSGSASTASGVAAGGAAATTTHASAPATDVAGSEHSATSSATNEGTALHPADPSHPVTPVQPANPFHPVDTVHPTDPSHPVDPVHPGNPFHPGNPVLPIDPVHAADPIHPVGVVAPVHPVKPAGPVDPVVPVHPVTPVAPVAPAGPPVLVDHSPTVGDLINGRDPLAPPIKLGPKSDEPMSSTPEPSSMLLIATGVVGVGTFLRRRLGLRRDA